MDDAKKTTISQVIESLTRIKEAHGDMYVRAVDNYGDDRYDIVFECGSGKCIITSGPQI